MNTDHLRAFVTLAEVGSINKAAKRLFLTPRAVKYALDTLEAETGFTLFTRTHAGLELTAPGATFAEYVTKALDLINEGLSCTADVAPDGRRIIDAPFMRIPLKDPFFFRAFSAFREAHPDIDVKFRQVDSFVGEHFDVINGFADVAHTRAVAHPLTTLPLSCFVAAGHPLADKDCVSIEELAPYDLLVPVPELVGYMDERTRLFLGSKGDSIERIAPKHVDSEFYPWCIERQRVALVMGEWPRYDDSSGLQSIRIAGGWFRNCIFTQEHPTSAVVTYVEFMQAFYAEGNASPSGCC